MAKTQKVVITRGVVYHDGKEAVDLLPGTAKKPNVVTLPESTAQEFIRTGHAVAAEDFEEDDSGSSSKKGSKK